MEMEYAAVLNFIQQRNLAFFILADDETEEERLADSIFADYIDEKKKSKHDLYVHLRTSCNQKRW